MRASGRTKFRQQQRHGLVKEHEGKYENNFADDEEGEEEGQRMVMEASLQWEQHQRIAQELVQVQPSSCISEPLVYCLNLSRACLPSACGIPYFVLSFLPFAIFPSSISFDPS